MILKMISQVLDKNSVEIFSPHLMLADSFFKNFSPRLDKLNMILLILVGIAL